MSEIRVLIVEDEPLIAEDIGEYLTNNDYSVAAIVHNLTDAIEAMQKEQPDIALLDINLGDNMDGLLIAEEINKSYHFRLNGQIGCWNLLYPLRDIALRQIKGYE